MRSSGSSQSDEANLETKTGSSKIDTSTHRVFWSNLNWGYRGGGFLEEIVSQETKACSQGKANRRWG